MAVEKLLSPIATRNLPYQVLLFWFVMLLPGVGFAVTAGLDDMAAFESRLAKLDGVSTRFTQQIIDARGNVVETSQGQLHLAKPNFRWQVDEPFPQTIVLQNSKLQIFDPDLEQLTVKSIEDQAVHDIPLALLTQTDMAIGELFSVSVTQRGAPEVFTVEPKSADALFQSLEFTFDQGRLVQLLFLDQSGQQANIRLDPYVPGQVIQSSVFELELPAGTDIVEG